MNSVAGAAFPLLIPVLAGAGMEIGGNYIAGAMSQPGFQLNSYSTWYPSLSSYTPSWKSLGYSAAMGAVSGGASGALIGASGVGALGYLSWNPGFFGLNFGIQSANPYK